MLPMLVHRSTIWTILETWIISSVLVIDMTNETWILSSLVQLVLSGVMLACSKFIYLVVCCIIVWY
jgi:hypothetical protein